MTARHHTPPTLTARLHLRTGVVMHRVGFIWSDGWFQVVEQTPDFEAALAMYYAAQAVAAVYPTTETQKAV